MTSMNEVIMGASVIYASRTGALAPRHDAGRKPQACVPQRMETAAVSGQSPDMPRLSTA